ncbi:hypothetical protein JDV09_13875 [Mycobacterium sp. Y57]|uniref:hypothetical protein n=1 Tax=Mycolicibacterium xanthum TaxID=2796469 RepID=UPI001C852071|nr:hypothetical protein [Mycolicibacterium xanthum]MBX7433189.1 hypothetical protein [Mycolicibacterium xanthum]
MRRHDPIEATMRAVEKRVLEDLWVGPVRRRAGRVLATVLGVTAALCLTAAYRHGHTVAVVAHTLLLLSSVTSLVGLWVRRFRWCCAAGYVSAVATVAGLGAFWWYRTGHVDAFPLPTALAGVLAAVLTALWISVLLTPVERSHPDLRARHGARR